MNKLTSFIQATRLKQIAIVFFAGVMLLVTTACSGTAQAKMPASEQIGDGGPNPANQVQPYKGGMNNFDDTPPDQMRPDKVKALVDNAKSNIQSEDPRNAKLYKDPGYAIDRTADKLGNDLKTRVDNAKEEAQKVGDRLSNTGDRAVEKTKEIGEKVQKGSSNVADNVGNSVVGAGEDAKYNAKTAGSSVKGAINDAKRAVKDAID